MDISVTTFLQSSTGTDFMFDINQEVTNLTISPELVSLYIHSNVHLFLFIIILIITFSVESHASVKCLASFPEHIQSVTRSLLGIFWDPFRFHFFSLNRLLLDIGSRLVELYFIKSWWWRMFPTSYWRKNCFSFYRNRSQYVSIKFKQSWLSTNWGNILQINEGAAHIRKSNKGKCTESSGWWFWWGIDMFWY